ncbi:MAG: hydrogenase nickel incorporation protein HypB [Deltaproteobacteria bacterium]|nr:hydrogenase nickel incorporation protein HypB [Deltaproteobacteria bacterium]
MALIKVLEKVLDANDKIAADNRRFFAEKKIVAVNLMSGPGAGKTTVLEKTLPPLVRKFPAAVIEGDIATTADAERIAALDVPVVQINTDKLGGACHLEALGIQTALAELPLDGVRYLFVENVGNLVCPAEFDLGETLKVGVLSVTEGEDKPVKYPLLFRVIDLLLLTKVDLLPHLRLDLDRLLANVRSVNAGLRVVRFSAVTGEGLAEWLEWLEGHAPAR